MKRIIDIPDETYNHFIRNEYYRTDIIAVHTALVYSTPYETVTEFADRCRECGERYGKMLKQEPKTGHWIFVDKAHEHAHCSECDYGNVDLLDGRPHNYCPNCGARMED